MTKNELMKGLSLEKSKVVGIIIVFGIVILMTTYAVKLNQIFYENFAPFFDSSSYSLTFYNLLKASRTESLKEAFLQSIKTGTVALSPFLKEASRYMTSTLMLPWLVTFGGSLFFYFCQFRQRSVSLSLASTLPFLGLSAFWHYNGGLSDFRMDLPFYVLLGTSFTWFLATRYTKSYWPWILTGIFLGLTCLIRSTTPVFATIGLLPLLFSRLFLEQSDRKKTTLKGTTLIVFFTFLISGWFYILNFDFIYYYYFIWNTDANANLPISESIRHVKLALSNIGYYSIISASILFLIECFRRWRSLNSLISINSLKSLDWESIWLGVSPVAFLVLKGAGLNPFVTIPSAFGIIMFLVMPFSDTNCYKTIPTLKRRSDIIVYPIFIIFMFSALSEGIESHRNPGRFADMQSHKKIIETVISDQKYDNSVDQIFLATSYVSYLNDTSLENIVKFDYSQLLDANNSLEDRIEFYSDEAFNSLTSLAVWDAIPVSSDDEKIAYLVNRANKRLNYIILPEDTSIPYIEPRDNPAIINRYVGQVKKKILTTGNWKPISDPIQVDFNEIVRVYRNEVR